MVRGPLNDTAVAENIPVLHFLKSCNVYAILYIGHYPLTMALRHYL